MSTSAPVLTVGSSSELLKDYWNEEQLAVELDTSVKSLRRWEEEKTGPPITKIGRRNYYRKSSVATWLLSREESRRRRRV